ncbi:tetratricopeptide repeat protein [Aquimarina sp. MAR_2010_214]|uniref:tetratricopeptide repeat protein n=1 Tax=Aquimarina sp. MAR_2010_214 TaxID=1250026 RepID=UPI000C706970|nr:tetratricopeptide repeat protein [Aquimarina sp. MAR_2010_214]PKV50696.1 tetratricopeptide repeat protein [Aquimarina sp. MAR_2010_214]
MKKNPFCLFRNYTLFLFIFLIIITTATNLCFSQTKDNHSLLYSQLEKIDRKIDIRDYNNAKLLISEIEENIDDLSVEDKLAIDLRIGEVQYYADHNEESINQLLINLENLKAIDTSRLYYKYNSFIGQVFKTTKNFKKAINYHKQALANAEKRNDTLDIIFSCLKIGGCFYRVKYIDTPKYYRNNKDSALFYYKKALRFPETPKNNRFFSRIYDHLSRIEMNIGDIDTAQTYANRALKINKSIHNSFGIAVSLSNLSNIYYLQKNYTKAIKTAKESNLFIKDKSLTIKRNNLENIAKNYQKLGDYDKAYNYLTETYSISKIVSKNTLNKKINTIEAKYNLAIEKQHALEEKNKRLKIQLFFYGALLLVVVLAILGLYFFIRNKNHKRKFEELMANQQNDNVIKLIEIDSKNETKIPIETVQNILRGLDKFEENNGFLNKKTTLNSVAKKLGTNSSYLSKIVNSHKNKNFAAYLNELRIYYVIKELKNNKQLRLYTIEAIADCMGYNNRESFSLAFRKITGLYPSYFIKQLQKQSP